ncbi:MAG: hypothetical protein GX050_06775 [Firmicutes bacterium]|nr:hypothetical protein [Bacillota bacterium]
MADCPLIAGCPFFNDRMKNMPAMAGIYKRNYCQGDNSRCARYMIFKARGREHVPSDLFPNQFERAERILQE